MTPQKNFWGLDSTGWSFGGLSPFGRAAEKKSPRGVQTPVVVDDAGINWERTADLVKDGCDGGKSQHERTRGEGSVRFQKEAG